MNNKYHGWCKTYYAEDILWGKLCDQGKIETGIYNWKSHSKDDSFSIKIKVNRDNITIVYNMLVYKLKVIEFEEDAQKCFPIIMLK